MEIRDFLREFQNRSGYDFCDYAAGSISRRLCKVSDEMGLTFEQILDRVAADKELVNAVVEDITVNTTELFRDPQVWVAYGKALPRHLSRQAMSTVWHVGCSTGLEVYSDLILLEELGLAPRVRVIGTDINQSVIDHAAAGVYPYRFNRHYVDNFNAVMQGLGLCADFCKYFDVDECRDTMTVRAELRSRARFLKQDLVRDRVPFAYRADVVFLRNVMIYFNEPLQARVLQGVMEHMHEGAILIMGRQEELPTSHRGHFVSQGCFYKKVR